MFTKKLILTALLKLVITDVEDDGTHNYLLKYTEDYGDHINYYISYSDKEPLPFLEGQAFKAKFEAECEQPIIPKESENSIGVSYIRVICNMNKLEIIKD